jgi:hypothetical protein
MVRFSVEFRRGAPSCGAALLLAAAFATPAAAQATYHVATVAELQGAIATVNSGPGGDLIVMAPGVYAITGALGLRRDVTIVGDPSAPTVIDGGDQFSILSVSADNVSIRNLTLQHGNTAISFGGRGVFSGTGITITANNAGFYPGDSGGNAFFTNSTIAGNTTDGIVIQCAELHLTNVTISNNGRGIDFDFPCNEHMVLTNSLIAGNGRDCAGGGSMRPVGDASLDGDGSCVALGFGPGLTTSSLPAIGLGGLDTNGGPTRTESIPGSSVAVGAGDNAVCPATDQRGYLRNDGACDIGAFEVGAATGGANTQAGSNVTVSPAPGVTLTFPQVTAQGSTTVTTGGPPPPAGFQVDGVVYDIATTADFAGWVTVCLPYSPTIDPFPSLAHYENIPPPDWVDRTTTVDTVAHVVCGDVPTLSPFAVVMAAGAGDVGDTLLVTPAGGGDITLTWGASCAAGDYDYAVYEGSLGGGYNHVARLCSTGYLTSATLTPLADNAYYLIVPRNTAYEGTYGRASSGAERPQGAGACAQQQVAPVCP